MFEVKATRQAINSRPVVIETVKLLTRHNASKQFPVNVHVNLTNGRSSVKTIGEIKAKTKKVEPKVDMIFLETASVTNVFVKEMMPQYID
ncbi:MAG: hypothetical protein M3Q99_13585 [Acidobacteriota bacterium]|nr:hypothetical protein [Acidobacteriota bacterium]